MAGLAYGAFRLEPDKLEKMKEIAQREERSISQVMRFAVDRYLETYEARPLDLLLGRGKV